MREYRARKRQSAGAGLDAPVAPSRAAVAEALAEPEPAASLEAGASPAVPEIPERFAATLRLLAGPSMQAPDDAAGAAIGAGAVQDALATLAKDCGYIFFRRPQLAHDRTAAPDPLEAP